MRHPLLIISLIALALHSCYTGVERTPRISEKQVRQQVGALSAEERFLNTVEGQPPSLWSPGKVFTLTSGKFNLAYLPASVSDSLAPGDSIFFAEMKGARTLAGAEMTDITFLTSRGQTLTHRVETPLKTLQEKSSLLLPFLVEASVVDTVKALLKGRDLWTTTVRRYDLDGNPVKGRKFQKITVADVVAGRGEFPIEVVFGNEMLHLSVEPGARNTRRFPLLFALSDPRKNYRHISDANWDLITQGQVKDGMTMEECRLALGNPKEVERTATYGALIERWTYENGIYLLFSDGVLTSHR